MSSSSSLNGSTDDEGRPNVSFSSKGGEENGYVLAYARDGKSYEVDGSIKIWVYDYMSFSHSTRYVVLRLKDLCVGCFCEGV